MPTDTALAASVLPSDSRSGAAADSPRADRAAFVALYRQHYALIVRYVARRVGDRHAVDDLVGEVFLAALRGLPGYRDRGLPVRAWLYRIATTTVNRWARRQRRWSLRRPLDAVRELAARTGAPPVESDRRFDAEQVRRALGSLPVRYQAALALHYLEGLGVEEAALALGCRPGTVKSRLARGRAALRRRLLAQGGSKFAPAAGGSLHRTGERGHD